MNSGCNRSFFLDVWELQFAEGVAGRVAGAAPLEGAGRELTEHALGLHRLAMGLTPS